MYPGRVIESEMHNLILGAQLHIHDLCTLNESRAMFAVT
jgi:hypothetical protein